MCLRVSRGLPASSRPGWAFISNPVLRGLPVWKLISPHFMLVRSRRFFSLSGLWISSVVAALFLFPGCS